MLDDFQLTALVKTSGQAQLLQIPLHQSLQGSLAAGWWDQYQEFAGDVEEIPFDAGYKPDKHECFFVEAYELPIWLHAGMNGNAINLNSIEKHENLIESIKAIIAFARNADGDGLMLVQNFSRSHVIAPGRFLFLEKGTYETPKRPGLSLNNRLTAVYNVNTKKLLFENFRGTNAILPLADFIAEASDRDIREVLNHQLLKPQDIEGMVIGANQWFRKRFAMLKTSTILDTCTVAQLAEKSKSYKVELTIDEDRVVFPADKSAAKRVLQFLNEELFLGPITESLYETNSKRAVSG